jgi:hypothetical protein
MAAIHLYPASEFYDTPLECETIDCLAVADIRVEQTHQDDGEFWALCASHAAHCVRDNMTWLAHDGEQS